MRSAVPLPLFWLRWLIGAIAATSLVLGFAIGAWMRGHATRETQAEWLTRAGQHARAEALYFDALRDGPVTVPLLVGWLDAHAKEVVPEAPVRQDLPASTFDHGRQTSFAEAGVRAAAVDELLAREDLPAGVALLGRYWRDVREPHEEEGDAPPTGPALGPLVVKAADAEPPMPWANHLLATAAYERGDLATAARRFEREGIASGRRTDLELALILLANSGDWDAVRRSLADSRTGGHVPTSVRFQYAVATGDWSSAAGLVWAVSYRRGASMGSAALAILSVVAWFAAFAQLGRADERPRVRLPLYAAALALGALSILPTAALVALEDSALHLEPPGRHSIGFVYFLFGVGPREELAKLLLFLPMIPVLRRVGGTPLDAIVCAALVGLGFAAVENVDYFDHGELVTALTRFLTANLFHMAMTGLIGAALYGAGRSVPRRAWDTLRTFAIVAVAHGGYDFLIELSTLSSARLVSYAWMGVFVLVLRWFTTVVLAARGRAPRARGLFETFAIGLSVLTGATYVYASSLVGPAVAATALLEGAIGLAVVAFLVLRQLQRLL
jgi:protease PrsW